MSTIAHHPHSHHTLAETLAENWWLILFRGVCAIVFGALAIAWPGMTLVLLILFYGIFVLADGALALVAAITGGAPAPRWWLALVGLLGIAAGVVTFAWPGLTALVLLFFIAAWAITTGIFQIVGAIQLRKEIPNEWMMILGGLLSVVFGLILLARPGGGALALILVIGVYAIIFGMIEIVLALRLRRFARWSSR